jgi:hypothetical protein
MFASDRGSDSSRHHVPLPKFDKVCFVWAASLKSPDDTGNIVGAPLRLGR